MASPVVTANMEDLFSNVEEKLRLKGIRHLPVVSEGGRLVGLITQRDLYRTLSPRVTEDGTYYDPASLNDFILKRVMTQDPVSLGPEAMLSEAVAIMARNRFGAIPVVDGEKKVIGILTETDVLKWLARQL